MNKQRKKIKVAVLQFPCVDGAVQENFRVLMGLLKKLHRPPDIIVLPEMWPSGFRVMKGTELLKETGKILQELGEFAQKKKCFIVGSHLSQAKNGFYNTASMISPQGKVIGKYHKVHLFALGGENEKFVPGHQAKVIKTKIGKLGLAICYDIRFPELIRKEVLEGAEILVIPSAWPKARIEHYRTLLRARAIENQCFVMSANKVGKNADGIQYGGHSVVIDPWGRVLGELKEKAGILQVEVYLKTLREIRKKFPVLPFYTR